MKKIFIVLFATLCIITVKAQTTHPLYILDGKETDSTTIKNLNEKDIAFVDVLKDSAAIRLYGQRGKNGVIRIFTKFHEQSGVVVFKDTTIDMKNIRVCCGETGTEKRPPLIILNGKEVDSSYLNTINPKDIEKIEVLIDKSAIKSYGEKSKNGVIIITTKKKAIVNGQ